MLSEVMLVFCHALALTETVAIGFSGRNYNPAFILDGTVGYFINKGEKKNETEKDRVAFAFALFLKVKVKGMLKDDVTGRSKKKIIFSTAPPPSPICFFPLLFSFCPSSFHPLDPLSPPTFPP